MRNFNKNQLLNAFAVVCFGLFCSSSLASDLKTFTPMSSSSWDEVLDYVKKTNNYWIPSPNIQPKAKARSASEFSAVQQLNIINEVLDGNKILKPNSITLFSCKHPACGG